MWNECVSLSWVLPVGPVLGLSSNVKSSVPIITSILACPFLLGKVGCCSMLILCSCWELQEGTYMASLIGNKQRNLCEWHRWIFLFNLHIVLKVWDHLSCKVKKYLLSGSFAVKVRRPLKYTGSFATREDTDHDGDMCQMAQQAESMVRCNAEEIQLGD